MDADTDNGQNPDLEMKTTDNRYRRDKQVWRDYVAYWMLGLCNNYGYVVMLSAAHDIIGRFGVHDDGSPEPAEPSPETGRMCNIMSTGTILLADIIPALIIKSIAPFLPFYINLRILIACLLQVAGFLLVAYAESEWMAILGVVFTSLSSGLGESSLLAYSSCFNKNVISTWSSGTGGAGVIGSLSYAGLIMIGLTPVTTLLVMLCVPVVEAFVFWVILRRPTVMDSSESATKHLKKSSSSSESTSSNETIATRHMEFQTNDTLATIDSERGSSPSDNKPLIGVKAKLRYMPSLLKYMLPLSMVYLFEYFINQGLFELVYFPNIWLNHSEQYRWLQVDYQIGVFISRSSVNIVQFKRLWLMAVFQFINVIIFTFEVVYFFMPSIWIIFAIVFWEGLLGGGAYVNTFYRMSKEIPERQRNFALGIVPIGDSIGIALAGFIAIPTHNAICRLAVPS